VLLCVQRSPACRPSREHRPVDSGADCALLCNNGWCFHSDRTGRPSAAAPSHSLSCCGCPPIYPFFLTHSAYV
jgi:hypothetical protein